MNATLTPTPAAPAHASISTADAGRIRLLAPYVICGIVLGIVLFKSEVIFWYRIQEMFRFQSFHMFGVLGSAWITALVSLQLLVRLRARARSGERVALAPKEMRKGHRYWIGGIVFGSGWALCGACPAPLFALIGSGSTVYVVTLVAALGGAWSYGHLRPHLPH